MGHHSWHISWIDGQFPLSEDCVEIKKGSKVAFSPHSVFVADVSPSPIDKLVQHFSCWYKLKRAVAWWLRLKHVLRTKSRVTQSQLTVAEIDRAELLVLMYVQLQVYGKEIKALASGEAVPRSSHLRSLNPLLDKDGILCVGGRFQSMLGSQTYPYIVPRTHKVAEMIVRDVHESTAHVGQEWTSGLSTGLSKLGP